MNLNRLLNNSLPKFDPRERDRFIREVSRATPNAVEQALNEKLGLEGNYESVMAGLLRPIVNTIVNVDSADVAGTRTNIRLLTQVQLTDLESGTRYKETDAYRRYTDCVSREPDQIVDNQQATVPSSNTLSPTSVIIPVMATSSTGTDSARSIDLTIDELLVAESVHLQGHASAISSASRKFGPCKLDLCILATDTAEGDTDVVGAFIEIKFVLAKDLKKTRLESPLAVAAGSPQAEPKLLSSEVSTKIKQGMSQALWYGCVLVEMARSDFPSSDRQPILGMLLFNGWFVRLLFRGTTVLVESTDQSSGSIGNLRDFLVTFKKGRSFPHNLVTPNGAAAMHDYVSAATYGIASSLASPTPDQTLDFGALETRSATVSPGFVLGAGLNTDTGEKAVRGMKRGRAKAVGNADPGSKRTNCSEDWSPSSSSAGGGLGLGTGLIGSSRLASSAVVQTPARESPGGQGQSDRGAGSRGGAARDDETDERRDDAHLGEFCRRDFVVRSTG
jgi:hypothetical protein